MAHLPPIGLKVWAKNDRLSASDLNSNFQALLDSVEIVMGAALMPDPVGVGNEVAIASHGARLAALERMVQLHARQRNEKEWAPMAHLGAVMQMVLELRGPVSERADGLLAAQKEARTQHDELTTRVARLEQQPEAATQEDFAELAQEFRRIAAKEHMLMAQVIALRHEVGLLRKMAMGHARERNEIQYATMAHVGAVVQMVKDLAARLPA